MKFEDIKKYLSGVLRKSFPNKTTLDKLSTSESGKLLFDGKELSEGNSEEIGYGYLGWLQSIGVTDTYNSLEEVLINEELVRELMNKHASCDYLFQWLESNPDILDSFTSNQNAMKWIGLKDYICDKLMAVDVYKEKLLSSAYWEYILKDKVPTMTSNTSPYGEANSSGNFVGSVTYYPYLAFNGITPTNTSPGNAWICPGTSGWIYYKFTNPINVKRLTLQNFDSTLHTGWDLNSCVKIFTVEASNDGNVWETILNQTENPNISANNLSVDIDNDKYYLYYRLSIINNHGYSNYTIIDELQFYGRSLNISVPTMTSNTEPYGEVSCSSHLTTSWDYDAYHAFDKSFAKDGKYDNAFLLSEPTGWLQYKFDKPVVIKCALLQNFNTSLTGSVWDLNRSVKTFKVKASQDGVEWVDISEVITHGNTSAYCSVVALNNNNAYQYYRFEILTAYITTGNTVIDEANFYGVDYSEDTSFNKAKEWASSGGISTNYESLSDLLDDELTVRQLMTKHDSADYLVKWLGEDSSLIDTICSSKNAMKWIGLRDYICDKLMAIDVYKEKLLASTYWEYILKDHVPDMTSNTTPYGEVSASSYWNGGTGTEPYAIFSSADATHWRPAAGKTAADSWIQYKFTSPIKIHKAIINSYVQAQSYTAKIQASNDGANWEDVSDIFGSSTEYQSSGKEFAEILNISIDTKNKYYLYYRFQFVSSYNSQIYNGEYITVALQKFQFYGRSLNISVPTMTSNTEPYGEVTESGHWSDYEGYKAFTGISWISGTGSEHWVCYKFNNPIAFYGLTFLTSGDSNRLFDHYMVLVSNDGNTWETVLDRDNLSVSTTEIITDYLTERKNCKHIKLQFMKSVSNISYGINIAKLNFYGVDYSERDNKDYIYDHGLEIKPVYTITSENGTAVKNEESLSQSTPGTNDVGYFGTDSALDLSTKKVARVVYGDTIAPNSNSIYPWILCSPTKYTDSLSNYTATKRAVKEDLPNNASLNLSNINDSEYIYCGTAGGNNGAKSEIVEWWLE